MLPVRGRVDPAPSRPTGRALLPVGLPGAKWHAAKRDRLLVDLGDTLTRAVAILDELREARPLNKRFTRDPVLEMFGNSLKW